MSCVPLLLTLCLLLMLLSLLPAVEQVAFADRILLNKTDLVGQEEKETIKSRIKVSLQALDACDQSVANHCYRLLHVAISDLRACGRPASGSMHAACVSNDFRHT
jgi:hypothetical protein